MIEMIGIEFYVPTRMQAKKGFFRPFYTRKLTRRDIHSTFESRANGGNLFYDILIKGGEMMKKYIARLILVAVCTICMAACMRNKTSLGAHDWMHETGPIIAPIATGDAIIANRAITIFRDTNEKPSYISLSERLRVEGVGEVLVPFFDSFRNFEGRAIELDGTPLTSKLYASVQPRINTSIDPRIEEYIHFLQQKDLFETQKDETITDAKLHTLELDLKDIPMDAEITFTFDQGHLSEIGANAFGMEDDRTFFTWTKTKDLSRAMVLSPEKIHDPIDIEIVRKKDGKEEKISSKISFHRDMTTVTEEMGKCWDAYCHERNLKPDDRIRTLLVRAATAKYIAREHEPSMEDVFHVALGERRFFFYVVEVDSKSEEKEIMI